LLFILLLARIFFVGKPREHRSSFYLDKDGEAVRTDKEKRKFFTDHIPFSLTLFFSSPQLDEMASDMNVEVESSASAIQFAFKSIGLSADNFPQAKKSGSASASMSTSAAPTEEPAVSS
jgi:hypothetical protein|tara:strand:+ start:885 stop:1241 length:357 start_codon:yes stop_codon:yes gene_type:complete